MRIAVVGASGRIGALTVKSLERAGHNVVALGRRQGVDVLDSAGMAGVFDGVDAVIDALNTMARTETETVEFFTTSSRNLISAEAEAGVRHHVTLTIAAAHNVAGNAHYAGKRAQEAAVAAGPVPYTLVPATQFHDFAAMVASWSEKDGTAEIAPLLVQPVAPADVAEVLARVASGSPQGRHRDVAGPDTHDLVDMARRTHTAQGKEVRLIATWRNGIFGTDMAGEVLLPDRDAEIATTTFDDWLATQAASIDSASDVADLLV